MTDSERSHLEGFAQTVGIPYAWNTSPPSSESFIVFPAGRSKEPGRTFHEYWDAISFLLGARRLDEPEDEVAPGDPVSDPADSSGDRA